jgi:hypothetical protein
MNPKLRLSDGMRLALPLNVILNLIDSDPLQLSHYNNPLTITTDTNII